MGGTFARPSIGVRTYENLISLALRCAAFDRDMCLVVVCTMHGTVVGGSAPLIDKALLGSRS
jgi:hypothetical protein